MKNAWAWLAAGAVLFLATGRGVVAALEGRAKPRSILIIGDSHSQGSWTLGGRLAAAFEAQGITTTQAAVPGSSVWWWLQENHLSDLLSSEPTPDLVIVELGGGDAARRVTQGKYNAQLRQFVEILRAAGIGEIVWLSPTKDEIAGGNDQRRQELADWQASKLPEFDVQVIEQRTHTDPITTTDGIHYSREGYILWAESLLDSDLAWLVA
jgi:lysophospholipase L1-like esterase